MKCVIQQIKTTACSSVICVELHQHGLGLGSHQRNREMKNIVNRKCESPLAIGEKAHKLFSSSTCVSFHISLTDNPKIKEMPQ